MFRLVDSPHLNVGGTLLGDQGPCIDTGREAPLSGQTARVYLGRPEAVDVARLAREAGWLDEVSEVERLAAVVAQRDGRIAELEAKLARVGELLQADAFAV